MRFKTKDLLVTVLPAAADKALADKCLFHTLICRHPSIHCPHFSFVPCIPCSHIPSLCGFCSFQPSVVGCAILHSCGPGGSACDPTFINCFASRDPIVIEHVEDLVSLRAELQETLKQLDVIQKEGLPSSIGSRAEAESLEQSLTAALEQVRAAKKSFK